LSTNFDETFRSGGMPHCSNTRLDFGGDADCFYHKPAGINGCCNRGIDTIMSTHTVPVLHYHYDACI